MEWIDIIQRAIAFIEKNLGDEKLSPEMVARNVHVSETYFSRAFNIITGYSISQYIRNRRLCIAGEILNKEEISVSQIAYDLGYDSPEAFAKAFKRFHGINPSESKKKTLKEFYPLQVKLTLIQEKPLSFTIQQKTQIFLSGKTDIVSSDDSDATSKLWKDCEESGYLDNCFEYLGFETLVGVSSGEGYTIKAKCKKSSVDTAVILPPSKWAIFNCEGELPGGILKTWSKIYTTWMTEQQFEIANLPQLEVYYETCDGYSCEIWIPVN